MYYVRSGINFVYVENMILNFSYHIIIYLNFFQRVSGIIFEFIAIQKVK